MTNQDKPKITMVEMEKRLFEDKSGDYRKSIIDKLNSFKPWVQQKMNSGLDSSSFEAYKKLQLALNQAEDCIKTF